MVLANLTSRLTGRSSIYLLSSTGVQILTHMYRSGAVDKHVKQRVTRQTLLALKPAQFISIHLYIYIYIYMYVYMHI